jgi:hypothetical protein
MTTTLSPALSPAAKKIIRAALTESTPTSIAAATHLTIQAVIANFNTLKKHNLAVYDLDNKVLTLTPEGIRVANEEPDAVDISDAAATAPAKPVTKTTPITLNITVTGTGTKKEKAWAIIEALAEKDYARKDIVAQLVIELGATKNNASQYYQNYRKAHGLVIPRAVKATETSVPTADDSDVNVEDTTEA